MPMTVVVVPGVRAMVMASVGVVVVFVMRAVVMTGVSVVVVLIVASFGHGFPLLADAALRRSCDRWD